MFRDWLETTLQRDIKMNNLNITENFKRNLLTEFKSFVYDETKLEIDFRTHVFLENQYGNYPQFRYSDAETIIDCVYAFLDKHFIDYDCRFNRSMDIESLRIQCAKDFIVNRLTDEIEKPLFYAVKNDNFKTFTSCSLADYCEEQSTVEVDAEDIFGKTVTFSVQTIDHEHRSDLGCWITTDNSNGDINYDDYPTFDINEIIYQAEQYIKKIQKITWASARYYIKKVSNDCFVVLEENRNFINSATSSYQREYEELETFSSKKDALSYINSL